MKSKVQFSPKSCANRKERYHKFLKPGALAQMRDARISVMWYRFHSLSQIYLRRALPPLESSYPLSTAGQPQTDIAAAADFPCFAGKVNGPLCLKRKKLSAIKSTWFPSPNLQTPTSDLTRDPTVDVLNSDSTAD